MTSSLEGDLKTLFRLKFHLFWLQFHFLTFPLLRLIAIFNEQELELLLSGLPDINIDDLKANTEYHKYSVTSLQIVW